MKVLLFVFVLSGFGESAMSKGKYYSDDWIICDVASEDVSSHVKDGVFDLPSRREIGFIHCARPSQMIFVANRFFKGKTYKGWVLDPLKITSPVRYDHGNASVFPHVYGPINLDASVFEFEVKVGKNGLYELPKEISSGLSIDDYKNQAYVFCGSSLDRLREGFAEGFWGTEEGVLCSVDKPEHSEEVTMVIQLERLVPKFELAGERLQVQIKGKVNTDAIVDIYL